MSDFAVFVLPGVLLAIVVVVVLAIIEWAVGKFAKE